MKLEMFKLVTGDVVLGDVVSRDKVVVVKKPMSLILDPMQGGIGMMPYDAIFTQEECESFEFNEEHIMYFMPIHETIEEAYIKQTTGIQLDGEEAQEELKSLENEIH